MRGQRTDTQDDLYRIAPLNGSIQLSYNTDTYGAAIETVGYARQDKVSVFNNEAETIRLKEDTAQSISDALFKHNIN